MFVLPYQKQDITISTLSLVNQETLSVVLISKKFYSEGAEKIA
jgi:hypothetical protein